MACASGRLSRIRFGSRFQRRHDERATSSSSDFILGLRALMSVFFLYPLFLFGLAAAALPVLIHLRNRRKLKRIHFPAVRFILLSQKRISRSYRLRHWILMALRTLAVVFLALLDRKSVV